MWCSDEKRAQFRDFTIKQRAEADDVVMLVVRRFVAFFQRLGNHERDLRLGEVVEGLVGYAVIHRGQEDGAVEPLVGDLLPALPQGGLGGENERI